MSTEPQVDEPRTIIDAIDTLCKAEDINKLIMMAALTLQRDEANAISTGCQNVEAILRDVRHMLDEINDRSTAAPE